MDKPDILDEMVLRDRDYAREIGKHYDAIREIYALKMANERQYRDTLEARTPHATPIEKHNKSVAENHVAAEYPEYPPPKPKKPRKERTYDPQGPAKAFAMCHELFTAGHRFVTVEMVVERFKCTDDAAYSRLRKVLIDKSFARYKLEWQTQPSYAVHRTDPREKTANLFAENGPTAPRAKPVTP